MAYNLEIEGIHTYYAGETPVLVHNSCEIEEPESFAGATRAEAEAELRSAGWVEEGPTARSGGIRWRIPGNKADLVRIMPGNPNQPNPLKAGPYMRFSIGGSTHGPFPLLDF